MCSAVAIAPTNSERIWVGYVGGRVSKTTTRVTDWLDVDEGLDPDSPPLPNRNVTSIAINPSNSNEVFVTVGGYAPDTVWFTADGGNIWQPRNGSGEFRLPNVHVSSIVYHPLNHDWIYVGTDLGVFASEDKGRTWNTTPRYERNEGPVNVEVDELFWQGDEYLIAATHGRGMFRVRPVIVVYIDAANTEFEDGTRDHPFNTVQEGIDAAGHGTALSIESANYRERRIRLYKAGRVSATGGTVRID